MPSILLAPSVRGPVPALQLELHPLRQRQCMRVVDRIGGTARTTVLARMERVGVIAGYTVRRGQDVRDQSLQAFVGITVSPKCASSAQ